MLLNSSQSDCKLTVAQDVREVLSSLSQPYLGAIKIYGGVLPHDYAFRLHNGSTENALCFIVQLWGPGSSIYFYEGSTSVNSEVDLKASERWGLLMTPKTRVIRGDIGEKRVDLADGGLSDPH